MSLLFRLLYWGESRKRAIYQRLGKLETTLMNGSGPVDYQESLRLISELKKLGFGSDIANEPVLGELATYFTYSLITVKGFEPEDVIKSLLVNYGTFWWLQCFSNDKTRSEDLREFTKKYLTLLEAAKDENASAIDRSLNRLNLTLIKGSTLEDYETSLRLISELEEKNYEFSPDVPIGQLTPAQLAYSLGTGKVLDEKGAIAAVLLVHLSIMSWWLECRVSDDTHPERTQESATENYVPCQIAEEETLLAELGRRDLLGPNPAISKLRDKGEAIVPNLLRLLDGDNLEAVVDAIQLLGEIGATQAIPKLQTLSKSQWAEVSQAAYVALAVLARKEGTRLRLDRARPFGQVGELWTAIMQGRKKLYPPEELNAFCLEAVAAMPELAFASKDDEGRTWGMLGSLLYKSVYPDWDGDWYGDVRPCPVAKECFEEAFRANGDGHSKDRAERIPEPAQ